MKTEMSLLKISLALALTGLALLGQSSKRISDYPIAGTLGTNDDFLVNVWSGSTNYTTKRVHYSTVTSNYLTSNAVSRLIPTGAAGLISTTNGSGVALSVGGAITNNVYFEGTGELALPTNTVILKRGSIWLSPNTNRWLGFDVAVFDGHDDSAHIVWWEDLDDVMYDLTNSALPGKYTTLDTFNAATNNLYTNITNSAVMRALSVTTTVGEELLQNPTFAGPTGWTFTNFEWHEGYAQYSGYNNLPAFGYLEQSAAMTSGKTYRLIYQGMSPEVMSANLTIIFGSDTEFTGQSWVGFTNDFVLGSDPFGMIRFETDYHTGPAFWGAISNVSLKQLTFTTNYASGLTTNLQVLVPGGITNTLYFENGVLYRVN